MGKTTYQLVQDLSHQQYLLRFGVLGMLLGPKYRTSGGGPGCLGTLQESIASFRTETPDPHKDMKRASKHVH